MVETILVAALAALVIVSRVAIRLRFDVDELAQENGLLRGRLDDPEGEEARLDVARGLRAQAVRLASEGYSSSAAALLRDADEILA